MSENTNRFAIDLSEMSEERLLIPVGIYSGRIAKATLTKGVSEPKDGNEGVKWARLDLIVAIKDEDVSKLLSTDEPKVFSRHMISFEKETGALSVKNNPDLGNLLAIAGLKSKEATALFQEGTEDAQDQWEFNTIFLTNIASNLEGVDLLVSVGQSPQFNDKTKMQNTVSKYGKA